MPGKVKVKIISGRNLPVMDRSSDTTDAYVEIKLGSTTYKTDVCRKSLHPQWNSDWYRFEVDDSELQDEPLQIRLMDHDTYSANDAIGKVYLDLNPLLLPAAGSLLKWNDGGSSHENPTNSVMTGWIPVYDTMHGIRGEVNIIVKVELFSDFNKFRQSSCGVQFFCSPVIPHGYFAQIVHGFVEELVVNDDPEYQWIDKIRTPRASNEARQTLFFKLSGELQRKIGLKALDLGGNAVIGYTQCFDLEGESGIVARGIGTAVTLVKMVDIPAQNNLECNANEERTQSYLKFLGSAKGFFLNTSSNLMFKKPIPPLIPSPAPSVKSLKFDERKLKREASSKIMTRHLSDREFNAILRPPPAEMIHHSTSLQTLLKQEDMRGTPGYGISQKFRNLKYSSQNMLSKKMFKLKAKLSDSGGTDDADNSDTTEAKKTHAYKYRRTQSDSTGMAEILVRSVFIAASSLDCITETPHVLKSQSSEQEDSNEDLKPVDVSYLSLPDTSTGTHSSNASSSSSDSSSLEEDASDMKENMELDTVSHIVETVRKLSMIQSPIAETLVVGMNNNQTNSTESKLLFVVEDDLESESDDDFNTSETLEPDEISTADVISLGAETIIEPTFYKPKLIIPPVPRSASFGPDGLLSNAIKTMLMEKVNLVGTYTPPTSPESADSTKSEGRSESFFPQFSKTFQRMKKSPTVRSFTDIDTGGFTLGTQFTSLHDIHGACSKVNKYSAHQGKETVLGHLFKRMDKKLIQRGSATDLATRPLEEKMMKPEEHHREEEVNISPIASPKEKHGIIDIFKEGREKIMHGPKVLFHRLDSKMHKKVEEDGLLGTALGNVLMDSVNEILATTNVTNSPSTSVPSTQNDNVSLSQSPSVPISQPKTPEGFLSKSKILPKMFHRASQSSSPDHSKPTTPESPKPKSPDGMFKEKIMKVPKVLFHRLDSKIHKKSDESYVKEEGLLHTALGNVLMESVNDVLATSSSTGSKPKTGPASSKTPKASPTEKKSQKLAFDFDKKTSGNTSDGSSTASPGETKSGFFKESKEKLFKAPKMFLQRLDSKIHKKGGGSAKSTVKNEQGLLGTALGNVLLESVNDVLATSSCDSKPNTPQTPDDKIANSFTSDSSDLTVKNVNTEIDTVNSDSINTMHACLTPSLRHTDTPPNELRSELGHQRTESMGTRMSHSPAKLNAIPCILRRSSDSDLSITPKGNSLTGSGGSGGCSSGQFTRNAMMRSTIPPENFDIMEYPFLTMSKYPLGFIAFIGGAVSARSVKLLERITNIEEPESRDTWWSEIRMEIRSHARALNCNSVLGYTETTSICDDVCVLSASGTAAIIGYQYSGEINDNVSGLPIIPKTNKEIMTTSLDRNDFEKEKVIKIDSSTASKSSTSGNSPEKDPVLKQACNICHLPYTGNAVPLRNSSYKCCICRCGKVPDVLISTIEMPDGIPSIGRGCFVQSYVCRPLRDLKGESNAKEISDGLPFLEYELHRLLINKLKVKGMNAVFGLKVRISVGERMLIGIATGTAVFLSPLPPPPLPKLVSDRTTDEKKLTQLQKSLHDTVKKNKEIYQLKIIDDGVNGKSDTDDSEDEQVSLDLSSGNKDCCILEVDDPEDVDVLNSLMEPRPPDGFHVVNTELVPGLEELEIVKNLQMFTQIWRAKIQAPYSLDKHFHRLLQSVYFKLRRMIPCALCDLQFRVDSPEPDEIQLCVLGMALGLGDPQKNMKIKRKNLLPKRNDDELIFNLEEDLIPEHGIVQTTPSNNYLHTQTLKYRQKSPIRNRLATRQRHVPYRERHGVDITPLSYVPGGKIEKYLGNLNFFFIRETTSIREEGGLSGFVHSFVTEILAIVRAHVTALGGNAMVAYFITECVLNHNLHKNQGQCLINVGGDVVYVTYYSEDH